MLVAQRYKHEVIALRRSELCRYPKEAVIHLSQTNPKIHQDLMTRWQKALCDADAWITKLSTGSSKKRMANLLLRLPDAEDSARCFLLSREDIGSILSMTLETASRTISDFKRSGLIIEISHNYFELDIPALNEVVAG
jgi:CRP-like cAMP-binding protein